MDMRFFLCLAVAHTHTAVGIPETHPVPTQHDSMMGNVQKYKSLDSLSMGRSHDKRHRFLPAK